MKFLAFRATLFLSAVRPVDEKDALREDGEVSGEGGEGTGSAGGGRATKTLWFGCRQ